MADSRRQDVVDAIKTAMQGITVANGFETNLGSKVYVWKGENWVSTELDGIDIRDVSDNIDPKNNGGSASGLNREDHKLQVEIRLATGQSESVDVRLRKMIADVYKKISADRTFGLAYCRTTWPRGDEMGLIQDGSAGDATGAALVKLEVVFVTKPFDPYA